MNNFFIKNKKVISYIFFVLFLILNFILLLKHEPWRDEIHAWLMAKTYSIHDLFTASNFDGHPILWHLLLMPFAKLNFPIITLNLISFIIVSISAYLFLFKTKLSLFFKLIVLFSIPFTYTYSVVSRNYCLVLLLLVLIGIIYPKRYKIPILYSLVICLLIHTHSLAWGIVAGLTITFHFHEIYAYFKFKDVKNIKSIIVGLVLIIFNTILVVLELYGTNNTDYAHGISNYIIYIISIIALILFVFFVVSIFIKKYWKEYTILFLSLVFQILIYTFFYSSVLYQRLILIFILILFYLLLLSSSNMKKKTLDIICIIYLLFICIFGMESFYKNVIYDVNYPYSSAQEIANYINENIDENSTVLIDASIIGQSIIPYLNNIKLYDIAYSSYVDCANVSYNKKLILDATANIEQYSSNYIIICNDFITFNDEQAKLIYKTNQSIVNEYFSLYYIY